MACARCRSMVRVSHGPCAGKSAAGLAGVRRVPGWVSAGTPSGIARPGGVPPPRPVGPAAQAGGATGPGAAPVEIRAAGGDRPRRRAGPRSPWHRSRRDCPTRTGQGGVGRVPGPASVRGRRPRVVRARASPVSSVCMELRHLRYFLAIASHRSFSRAAAALGVSQPTLSEQIQQLEAELGVTLFERLPRRVELTEAGRLLRERGERVLRELDAAQGELAELQGLVRGTVRVGVFHSFSASLLPQILGRFSAEHPGVHVVARLIPRDQMERELLSGEIDLAVAYSSPDDAHIVSERLFREPMRLVVGPRHPLAGRRSLPMRALDGQELVLLTREFAARQYLDQLFGEQAIAPRIMLEMNTMEPILATVQHSRLASIVAVGALHPDTGLRAIRLASPEPVRDVALLWRRHDTRTRAARRFAELVREAYGRARVPGSASSG